MMCTFRRTVLLALAMMSTAAAAGRVPIKGDVGGPGQATVSSGSVSSKAFGFRMAGKVDGARAYIEQSMLSGRGGTEAMFELARIEFYEMDFDKAESMMGQIISAEPSNAKYHYWAGLIASYNYVEKAKRRQTRNRMGVQFAKATSEFSRAVQLDPKDLRARLKLVELYGNTPVDMGGDPNIARAQCAALQRLDIVYGARARSIIMHNNLSQDRLSMWAQLLTNHSDNAGLFEGLGREFLREGNITKGAECLDRAMKIDPKRSYLLLTLAFYQAGKKDLASAEDSVRAYLDGDPSVPMRAFAMVYLAKIRKGRGDDAGGSKLLAQARNLDKYCWQSAAPPPEELFEAP